MAFFWANPSTVNAQTPRAASIKERFSASHVDGPALVELLCVKAGACLFFGRRGVARRDYEALPSSDWVLSHWSEVAPVSG